VDVVLFPAPEFIPGKLEIVFVSVGTIHLLVLYRIPLTELCLDVYLFLAMEQDTLDLQVVAPVIMGSLDL